MADPERHPTDQELLTAVHALWEQLDPPPADLAEGVLSRLAAQDLEFELLTLVEQDAAASGARSVTAGWRPDLDPAGAGDTSWSLEYAGPTFRLHLRIARTDGLARIDGWIVPARPMTVRISTERPYRVLQQTDVDERGRFELVGSPTGLCRLFVIDRDRPDERPAATPPFWI